jgi:hypothetical protein
MQSLCTKHDVMMMPNMQMAVYATHDYFFRCRMYLLFRAEFAAGVWHRNTFPLCSWQVFIARIEFMLRVMRLYTLGGVKHDFNTCSWSCVNWSGLRIRLFPSWRCIKWPSLRWGLHTSHSDLRQWTKHAHEALRLPLWWHRGKRTKCTLIWRAKRTRW